MQKPLAKRTFYSSRLDFPLVAIRHGQAIYTPEEDAGGDIVEGIISDEGKITTLESAAEIIKQLHSYSISKVKIYSSPKRRCLQTRDIILDYLKKTDIRYSFHIDKSLRDVKVIGPENNLPNSYTRWEENMLPGENWYISWVRKAKMGMQFFQGEESPQDVKMRVEKFFDEILPLKESTILICHEEILGAIAEAFELKCNPPTYAEVWYIYPKE